jgi:hypothetical protein
MRLLQQGARTSGVSLIWAGLQGPYSTASNDPRYCSPPSAELVEAQHDVHQSPFDELRAALERNALSSRIAERCDKTAASFFRRCPRSLQCYAEAESDIELRG